MAPWSLAIIFCLANAFKPAVIDDPAYLFCVPAILANPAQPYGPPPDGFELIWYQEGQGAFSLLLPMVMPYWLAAGAATFGQNLILLKLWLFPFCLILLYALAALFKRFAPGCEKPLLTATALSPAFLPSLNVMIDLPSLALELAAVTLFMKAVDSEKIRWQLVLLSGVLGGLAAQTKYTGATAMATICLYAVIQRRVRAAIVAAAISAALFVGWEAYLCKSTVDLTSFRSLKHGASSRKPT